MAATIATRFLILSDTHSGQLLHPIASSEEIVVVIHCGDMTEESKLDEYRTAIKTLTNIKAPLKLVIAGNHEFSLDEPVLQKHMSEASKTINGQLLEKTYGKLSDARALFSAESDIVLLEEGTHHFDLSNGAHLTVYASPYTASKSTGWGYSYDPDQQDHAWNIKPGIDMAITHSPPKGMLDYTDTRQRAGISTLFEAIAHAKPKVHCFGHIHEAWGAKLVTWREQLSETPSHFTAIDNGRSQVIERKFDAIEEQQLARYQAKGFRDIDGVEIQRAKQTLFVNAAIEGPQEGKQPLPWLLSVDLPRSQPDLLGETRKRQRSLELVEARDVEDTRKRSKR